MTARRGQDRGPSREVASQRGAFSAAALHSWTCCQQPHSCSSAGQGQHLPSGAGDLGPPSRTAVPSWDLAEGQGRNRQTRQSNQQQLKAATVALWKSCLILLLFLRGATALPPHPCAELTGELNTASGSLARRFASSSASPCVAKPLGMTTDTALTEQGRGHSCTAAGTTDLQENPQCWRAGCCSCGGWAEPRPHTSSRGRKPDSLRGTNHSQHTPGSLPCLHKFTHYTGVFTWQGNIPCPPLYTQ